MADIFLFVSFIGTVNGEDLIMISQIRQILSNFFFSQSGVEFGHFWIIISSQVCSLNYEFHYSKFKNLIYFLI